MARSGMCSAVVFAVVCISASGVFAAPIYRPELIPAQPQYGAQMFGGGVAPRPTNDYDNYNTRAYTQPQPPAPQQVSAPAQMAPVPAPPVVNTHEQADLLRGMQEVHRTMQAPPAPVYAPAPAPVAPAVSFGADAVAAAAQNGVMGNEQQHQRVTLVNMASRMASVGPGERMDNEGVVHYAESEPVQITTPDHNTFVDRRTRLPDGSIRAVRPHEQAPASQQYTHTPLY
mmetsp:Transcript_10857/g.23148  ORF Transcript_10857/g.23148 Transcript_10857/m.23148 type:complete len:229 (+) Transcript_10857:1734-2420(+)|eukprot:CAMPEP_0185852004 /NCGR_PEP_ID=MMETSP1354-20130828/12687_1 /TAXON_ID=708628 /ORGANISM="Erythrolobus madagascarensis, Strain CCMP3276" /LENGTH=228 /DNA_ID=CAMNT_0028553133 /DNA_START=90 /DNA_END=776 /DNA_ORIENTATION=-